MQELKDKVAFITGGAQGIGLGIAQAFAAEGVKIALADINTDALSAAAEKLGSATEVKTFELDVRDRDRYAQVAAETEATVGPVSLLFNNAGVAPAVPVQAMTYQSWDWAIDINLKGVINGLQTFLPAMLKRGDEGHVVSTASGAGLAVAGSGYLYTTTKFAVVGLSESLRQELESTRIGVSVLCPGPVDTNILTNTRRVQPRSENAQIEDVIDAAVASAADFLKSGKSIDEVGQCVLRAVKANELYIHTDAYMASFVRARTDAILAAMPPT